MPVLAPRRGGTVSKLALSCAVGVLAIGAGVWLWNEHPHRTGNRFASLRDQWETRGNKAPPVSRRTRSVTGESCWSKTAATTSD